MAGQPSTDSQFNPYLSTTQQDLLLAALASNGYPNGNAPNTKNSESSSKASNNGVNALSQGSTIKRSDSDPSRERQFVPPSYVDGGLFDSTSTTSQQQQQQQQSADFTNFDFDDTSPYLDYLDGDTSLNFDSNDLNAEDMFGNVPGPSTESSESDKGERSDKRKSPDEADEDDDGDPKRREGDDKTAKKPGRKPLTSEPTTKRKAQNRAAQRAFRERKEKHLKDLETKVESLSKASEADKQENSQLRAQVERLQSELREYKKRMSMASTGISQSPPSASRIDARINGQSGSDFQFDFPRFGGLPGSQLFDNAQKRDGLAHPSTNAQTSQLSRHSSLSRHQSPKNQGQGQMGSIAKLPSATQHSSRSGSMNAPAVDGFNSTLPQMSSGLFTSTMLNGGADYGFGNKTASPQHIDNSGDSNSGISRAFRFNSGSTTSNTASPSLSSLSQYNANSSCGTSPESTHDSPPSDTNKPKSSANTYSFNSNPTNQKTTFADIGNTTNGNTNNPSIDFSFDWLANQSTAQFDPVLFGDYRESQDALIGDGDFNTGFFNDAFPYDFGSPLNFDLGSPKPSQQTVPASRNLLAEVERAREGNDEDQPAYSDKVQQVSKNEDVPLAQAERMLNCNTIWSQLQQNPDFQDGKFDLDGLCAELRAKAKCSESGVTVPSEHVDAAFKKLSGVEVKPAELGHYNKSGIDYLFQRDSVDEALKRLGGKH